VRRQSPDANSVQLLGWAVGQRQRRSALLERMGPTEDKRQLERKAAAAPGRLNPTEGWGSGQRRRRRSRHRGRGRGRGGWGGGGSAGGVGWG